MQNLRWNVLGKKWVYMKDEPFLCSRLSNEKMNPIEVRGFPSTLFLIQLLKYILVRSEFSFLILFIEEEQCLLNYSPAEPTTPGCILLIQLFQPARIPAVVFPVSDEKFIKAVVKLQ